jgi:CheY-like chemotaxis protein/HPt (histidine-containing phosphotransfer) domain-containing protein
VSATGQEDEFRRLFREEAETRLRALAEQALELEARAGDPDLVTEMFRNAHTLKGGAGIVGFTEIGTIVHELETLIDDLRAGRRPPCAPVTDAVLRTVDALRDMVARAIAGEDQDGAMLSARAALARADATAPLAAAALEQRPVRARVLVVDDAPTTRELQRSILERAGYAVTTAVDGEDALRRLAEAPVDLVLTDVEMPGVDGFALTEAIRASEAHQGLPVVILTSRTDDADRRRGLDAGADAYLMKRTFDEPTLLTAVARLLGEPG